MVSPPHNATTDPQANGLSRTYPVSTQQVQRYRRDGHVFLPQLLPCDSIAPYREAIVATADRYSRETRPLDERDTYGKAFLQIFNLWTLDDTVRRFVQAPRFAEVAARLLGVERVRLYHDQALFKEAGGGITPWHQDQYYWPLDTQHTITLWMPLVDIEEDMGMMQFASGAHRLGYITNKGISDDSEAFYERFVAEKGLDISEARTARAGDASFHAGWALHRAPPNQIVRPPRGDDGDLLRGRRPDHRPSASRSPGRPARLVGRPASRRPGGHTVEPDRLAGPHHPSSIPLEQPGSH